jgi:hypothetical protein
MPLNRVVVGTRFFFPIYFLAHPPFKLWRSNCGELLLGEFMVFRVIYTIPVRKKFTPSL